MLRKLFVFIVCLMVATATASAQTPPDNEIWYTTTDGRTISFNDDDLVSNSYNNGRGVLKFRDSVTSIEDITFWGRSSLTSITIPNSVTSIGQEAFSGCSSLKSITIPNGVTSIGDDAFYGCSSLTSITIPKSVTSIEYCTFIYCSSLTSITIPDSVTSIEDYAFAGCSSLTSITIPNSVTSIGEGAFDGCSSLPVINNIRYADTYLIEAVDNSLTSYSIKEGTRFIGGSAFARCSDLTSIAIPNSVTIIGEYAFFCCSSLKNITIPNSVTNIGYRAFDGCSSLTSITIPNSVTSIGWYAFSGCSSLKSVKVANKYCYDYFKNLGVPDITFIVSTPKEYEEAQQLGATKLAIDSNSKYASKDGLCLIDNGKLILFIGKDLTEYTIPESVTSIRKGAFNGCSRLKSIKVANKDCYDYFKDKVANIAFYGANASDDGRCLIIDGELKIFIAKGITEYTIPESVTSIGDYTFNGCSNLTSITIGKGMKSIGEWTFNRCSSLKSITIPNSVTSIGKGAFFRCSSLTSITIPNSVTWIGDSAFYNCSSLTSVTIPDSVTSIGNAAFYNCSSLKSITIPNSVTSIGNEAFRGCSSLTSITIGNSVTSIERYAFSGCSSLKSVKVANKYCYDYFKDKVANITFYGANASDDGRCLIIDGKLKIFIAKGITEYTIPESVTSIGEYAFAGCSSLTSITIPESVTSIGEETFRDCSSLTNITCLATTPPAIDDLRISETTMIYVPKKAVKAYKKDPKWSIYEKQIKRLK